MSNLNYQQGEIIHNEQAPDSIQDEDAEYDRLIEATMEREKEGIIEHFEGQNEEPQDIQHPYRSF